MSRILCLFLLLFLSNLNAAAPAASTTGNDDKKNAAIQMVAKDPQKEAGAANGQNGITYFVKHDWDADDWETWHACYEFRRKNTPWQIAADERTKVSEILPRVPHGIHLSIVLNIHSLVPIQINPQALFSPITENSITFNTLLNFALYRAFEAFPEKDPMNHYCWGTDWHNRRWIIKNLLEEYNKHSDAQNANSKTAQHASDHLFDPYPTPKVSLGCCAALPGDLNYINYTAYKNHADLLDILLEQMSKEHRILSESEKLALWNFAQLGKAKRSSIF